MWTLRKEIETVATFDSFAETAFLPSFVVKHWLNLKSLRESPSRFTGEKGGNGINLDLWGGGREPGGMLASHSTTGPLNCLYLGILEAFLMFNRQRLIPSSKTSMKRVKMSNVLIWYKNGIWCHTKTRLSLSFIRLLECYGREDNKRNILIQLFSILNAKPPLKWGNCI